MRLTKIAKVLIVLVILGAAILGSHALGLFDGLLKQSSTASGGYKVSQGNSTTASSGKSSRKIVLTLDEWIGWKSILDANGGLKTQPGSLMAKNGVDLEINVVNDATQSSTALIKGDVNAAGYTVNRYAFLYPKFKAANVPVKMPYITNSSSGGDGIISKDSIKSVEQLVGKKIAVPRYSEAQTLVMWLINQSNMTADQRKGIIDAMVYFDTPDDAAKAFFAGKVDAAATWEPYITQAASTTGARPLFSTKSATNLILDGIVFREDFLKANGATVTSFIKASLEAKDMYKTDMKAIKAFPLFSTMSDAEIKATSDTALLSNYADNVKMLNETAKGLYTDMCAIWSTVKDEVTGEKLVVLPKEVDTAFTNAYITPLKEAFVQELPKTITFDAQTKEKAKAQDNTQALLKQTLTINFKPNLAIIEEVSYGSLQGFAKTATILNGAIMQIEGNTDITGEPQFNKALSEQRAKSVAAYLQSQGVDASRFLLVGNGSEKPIAGLDQNSEAGKTANRRTDVYFKVVE